MEENKTMKNRLLTALIIGILCVIFVVGFIYGLNKVLAMEGAYPPSNLVEGLTAAPETAEEAVAYLNNVYNKAVAEKPKFESGKSYSINGDTYETDFSDTFKSTLDYIKDNVCAAAMGDYAGTVTEFGDDFSKSAVAPAFKAGEVTDFVCNYIYYQCPSCGETSDEMRDSHPECGSENPFVMKYRDEYEIVLHIKANLAQLDKAELEAAKANALKIAGDYAEAEDLKVEYELLTVTYRVGRLNDELHYLGYSKDFAISMKLSGKNDYESLGSGKLAFKFNRTENYNFTWPALTLSADEMVIEPKGNDNLLATLTCTDPLKCTVTWASSDESLITVDEEGYMKAAKATGDATVTASFEFNGKTYTDECIIHVRVPVESVSMSKRSAKLAVGETLALKIKTDPAKATIQTAQWFTEDESVATVDENGVVTAVGSGVTKVYALSDDGYFKSSCEVTVK